MAAPVDGEMNFECDGKIIEENLVKIYVDKNHENPKKNSTFFNPVMKICREMVLCALSAFSEDHGKVIKCLDAFGASGISGLLWKTHVAEHTCVTVNDMNPTSIDSVKRNCSVNGVPVCDVDLAKLLRLDSMPDTEKDKIMEQYKEGIEVTCSDANVLMHQRQFHFIHLDPYGSAVQFLDAAFRNIYNGGIVVVTSTDIAALYGKVPNVTLRNYGAFVTRTEYMKELAARVVLASVARSAAKCNKGIDVLYTVSVEHFVQVAVRVNRGASHADACVTKIRKLLHCQMCEERAFYPHTNIPQDNVYNVLPCNCQKENLGQTAIELGPLWCDGLFSFTFLKKMAQSAMNLKLGINACSLLNQLLHEAACSLIKLPQFINLNKNSSKTDTGPEANDSNLLEGNGCTENSEDSKKRKSESLDNSNEGKRFKTSEDVSIDHKMEPPFYYDIHKRKMKVTCLPKAQRLVQMLQDSGHRASRTHFSATAVRTDATLSQLRTLISIKCSTTSQT